MGIDQAVRAYLAAQATVTAVVSTRVYCGDVPQTASLPAISISVVSAQHAHTLKGVGNYCTSRIQINCWADTHLETKTIGEILRQLLQGLGTTTMGTVVVNAVTLTNETDMIDPPMEGKATGEYHLAQDYSIRFNEVIS